MDFVFIILLALGALIITRILFIFLYSIEVKAENKEKVGNKEKTENKILKMVNPIMHSLGCLGLFLGFWGISILMFGVPRQTDESLKNLAWYVVFTFFGVAAIIWCYFRWDFKWKAIPRFEDDKTVMALKKIIVFCVVMGFAFYHGYEQMDAIFKGKNADDILKVYNVTIISGMIALDRVLNQVSSVCNGMKDKEEEQKEGQTDKKKD